MTIVAYLTVFLGLFLMFLALRRILLSLGAIFLYKVPTESGNTRYRFKVVCVCRNESRNLKRLISGLRSLSYDEKLLELTELIS
jgi:predicted membrane-bound dolichyl-phosphate-mannose-protein mannosyltransferase